MRLDRHHRRGSAYVCIVGACTLVAVMGLSALMVARVQLRTGNLNTDVQEARSYARSAMELGKLAISQDPNWRTTKAQALWINGQSIGTGTMTLEAIDPNDGSIKNWLTDPVILRATGSKGSATQIEQIMLVPRMLSYTCLELAAFSGGTFSAGGTITANRAIGTNSNFIASGTVDADVEAAGSISGSRFLGSRAASVAARTLPPSTVFDHYIANATTITYGSTSGSIQDTLLSPTRNPYGAQTNPLGIYLIDCGGQTMQIKNSRIVGTLILVNCKSDSKMQDSVLMTPAVANFPSLLISGSFNLEQKKVPLTEPSGKSLNPPGTPYEGSEDNDSLDTFPSVIKGLVYVSGNLTVRDSATLEGPLIVTGTLTLSGAMECRYNPLFLANPPPGFCDVPQMVPMTGSSKRLVN